MKYFRYFPKMRYDLDGNGSTREVVDIFRLSKIITDYKDDITFYRTYVIQDGERPDHVSQKLYGEQEYYWTFFIINKELKNYYEDWPKTSGELEISVKQRYPGYIFKYDGFDLVNKFVIGETLRGMISGATCTIDMINTNLGWVKISNIVGDFVPGELVRGDTTLDQINHGGVDFYYNANHHFENADGEYVWRGEPGAAAVSISDYEKNVNELKREIRVIRPEFVGKVKRQFRDSLNG